MFKRNKNKNPVEETAVSSEVLVGDIEQSDAGPILDREQAPPLSILIGFIGGSKHKEADGYVRGMMLKFCNDLENAGYNLMKFRGGYAYEIQEGGDSSWLKSILKTLEEKGSIVVPAGTRHIKLILEETGIQPLLLSENDKEMKLSEFPQGSGKLKPYHNYRQRWLTTTATLAIFSMLSLVMAVVVQKTLSDREAEKIVIESLSKTQTLPILYWPEVLKADEYVAKLEFKDGRWHPPVMKSLSVVEEVPMDEDPEIALEIPQDEVIKSGMPGAPDIIVKRAPVPEGAAKGSDKEFTPVAATSKSK